ncbi:conserved hypothetical protein [Rhodospirillaceae bacterium LM-1]|nr:conserved hypothetical protein [Rhodospirillaceae bacterium LM-1]
MTGKNALYGSVYDEAWVGFRNNTGLAWLRLLKPGFRHCFLLLRKGGQWVVYDPLAHHTRIDLVDAGYELLDVFSEKGCRLIPADIKVPPLAPAPWRPYSCVEAVKRALGLKAGWVLTPWQLYRFLTCPGQNQKKFLFGDNYR